MNHAQTIGDLVWLVEPDKEGLWVWRRLDCDPNDAERPSGRPRSPSPCGRPSRRLDCDPNDAEPLFYSGVVQIKDWLQQRLGWAADGDYVWARVCANPIEDKALPALARVLPNIELSADDDVALADAVVTLVARLELAEKSLEEIREIAMNPPPAGQVHDYDDEWAALWVIRGLCEA